MGKNAVKWPLGVSQQTGDVKQTDYGSNELKIKYRRWLYKRWRVLSNG